MNFTKLILIGAIMFTTSSCAVNDPLKETFGQRIEENIQTVDGLDDNYRNYYEIFVSSFCDSNNDGSGDLNGITSKLEYLKELNYNGIWLTPINSSPSYHKYDVSDYYKIDPKFGTMDDLENLIKKAHSLGIKVIIDLVINHSSSNHKLFAKSAAAYEKWINGIKLSEEEKKYYDYYSFFKKVDDPDTQGKILYKYPGKNFFYEGNFSSGMPEPNFDNLTFREDINKIAKFYLDLGIDGFRLDAVKYYYLNNTTKNVEVLRDFNNYVKSVNKNAYIVGECWDGDGVIEQYYQSGIDSFFYFSASSATPNSFIETSVNLDGSWLNTYLRGAKVMEKISEKGIEAPFLDNHDMVRYTKKGDVNLTKYMYGLLSMLKGTSFTYYGDEVGMVGSNGGELPDQNVRTPIKWGEENNQDNTKILAGTSSVEYPYGTVKENMENQNSLYHYYKKANYIRLKYPCIARGETVEILTDKENATLLIKKIYNGEEVGILFNFSGLRNITTDITQYGFKDVVSQLVADNENGYIGKTKEGIILPPYSIAILN